MPRTSERMRSAYGHAGSAAARRAAARYERWSENRALRHRLRDCRSACADSPDNQSAFRGETDGPRDIRGCRNPARTRCARGLLRPGAPRNARGSYGRLEIRVVLRASDRQPFLTTSSHKRVETSEALSRTHVDAQSASLICGRYRRLFPSDGLTGTYPRLAGLLLDHASRILVLAQSDKLRMAQPIRLGPFPELSLHDRFWPQPNCVLHFLGVEFLPKS